MTETAAIQHRIHDRLPSGFTFANDFQTEEYNTSGSVNGAAKVVLVRTGRGEEADLAIRLRPPRSWEDVISPLAHRERPAYTTLTRAQEQSARDWYIGEYNKGWAASRRQHDLDRSWTTHAFDDGYLDYAAGRAKWHLTYCTDHDTCGEG